MFLDNRKNIKDNFFYSFQKNIVKIAQNKNIKQIKDHEALQFLKDSISLSNELGLTKIANQLQNLVENKTHNPEDFIEQEDLIIV